MLEMIGNWLQNLGLMPSLALITSRGILFFLMVIMAILVYYIAKRPVMKSIIFVIEQTKTDLDDAFLQRKILNRLAYVAPALAIYLMTPIVFQGISILTSAFMNAALIAITVVAVLVMDTFLNTCLDIYGKSTISKEIPLKGFAQVLKMMIYFLGLLLILSFLLSKSPLYLISGLGALTAVFMLVFKDIILGFVAGIQLISNRMIANGDWIEMPQYGADGNVIEIALTTVKVQNWDKTVTTVPAYSLVTSSFKNWRGMENSEGRRIKRSILLDIHSIRFCTEEMLKRFSKIQYIQEYLIEKQKEIEEDKTGNPYYDLSIANGRRLTNVGTFRSYVKAYLKNHPMINQNMTFLVRQLAPAEKGLPMEIYIFCKEKVWADYETIQGDIFDHLLAVVPEFDLKVFQNPTHFLPTNTTLQVADS